jgi:hypothetical protein
MLFVIYIYINFKNYPGAAVRGKKILKFTVACPYCLKSLEPRKLLLMLQIIVPYEGKSERITVSASRF